MCGTKISPAVLGTKKDTGEGAPVRQESRRTVIGRLQSTPLIKGVHDEFENPKSLWPIQSHSNRPVTLWDFILTTTDIYTYTAMVYTMKMLSLSIRSPQTITDTVNKGG